MKSRRVVGEHTPTWACAGLLALGLGSWAAAGGIAHAGFSGARARVGVWAPLAVPRPPAEGAAASATAQKDQVVILPAVEACAPVVELRFDHGAADVSDAENLREIAAAASSFKLRKVVVEGYASTTGPSHKNLKLSHRRARRAKAELVQLGVDAGRITIQAFGEYRPSLRGNESRDRRVVVRIEGVLPCVEREGAEPRG